MNGRRGSVVLFASVDSRFFLLPRGYEPAPGNLRLVAPGGQEKNVAEASVTSQVNRRRNTCAQRLNAP